MDIIKFRTHLNRIKEIRLRRKKDLPLFSKPVHQKPEIEHINPSVFFSSEPSVFVAYEGIDALIRFQISILSNENSYDEIKNFTQKFQYEDSSEIGKILYHIKIRSYVELAKGGR